jgi:hypothetical protein
MVKKIIVGFILLISITVSSQQKSINDYKYVIVPKKFDFLNSNDQYQTSSLTKFLLQKKGFTVFKSDESLPDDLANNRCLALIGNVIDTSSLFSIKTYIVLKDCNDNEVYSSQIGKSKIKEYKKGYHESIRKAYASMSDLSYSYTPKKNEANINAAVTNNLTPTKSTEGSIVKKEVIPSFVVTAPIVKAPTKQITSSKKEENNKMYPVLYAQPKGNGYQLINAKPEIVFIILKTNSKDRFIIKNKNGSFTKTNDIWVAEFYEDDKFQIQKYQVKF